MQITIDGGLALKLGFLVADQCDVGPSDASLAAALDGAAAAIAREHTPQTIAADPVVRSVKGLFRSLGVDPSRYRPSAEALLRRVVKGQKLTPINAIVDINNLYSLRSRLPFGCYDRALIVDDVHARLGRPGERYAGIGRDIDASGKLVVADGEGPFGSPTADSARTKITLATGEVLVLAYAPSALADAEIRSALDEFATLARRHAGARCASVGIAP